MESITDYIKPELLIVAIVLAFINNWLEQISFIQKSFRPFLLTVLGIFFCSLWVFSNCSVSSFKDVTMALFVALVQGILIAGFSSSILK